MTSRRACLAAAATAGLLASCSGESAPAAQPSSTAATITAPLTNPTLTSFPTTASTATPSSTSAVASVPAEPMHAVAGDGFALDLPATWSAYRLSPDGGVQAVDRARSLPTELEGVAVAAALQGGSLFAVAPSDNPAASGTLLVTRLAGDRGSAVAGVSDALRNQLATQGISDIRVEEFEVSGRPAARATFRRTGEDDVEHETTTLYVPGDRVSFVLSFSRPVTEAADAAAAIDEIMATFRTA